MESITKWQPSVLHLLPFSNNNAGTSETTMVASQSSQRASYSAKNDDKRFPSLATKEKPRSKSAAVVQLNRNSPNKEQQQRLLRATSERLSRIGRKPDGRLFVDRSNADQHKSLNRKLTQEVVSFAIKDINEQILGRNGDSNLNDQQVNNENHYRMKPVLKPNVKLNDSRNRFVQSNGRFWRSATFSPGERDLQSHKASLDFQLASLKKSKRVKLNVKDLPRSQTPVGENDPDRLNMKHVIQFLQANSEDRQVSANSKYTDRDKELSNDSQNPPNITKLNGMNDKVTAIVIAAKSRRRDEAANNTRQAEIKGAIEDKSGVSKLDTSSNHYQTNPKNLKRENNAPNALGDRPKSYGGVLSDKNGYPDKAFQSYQRDWGITYSTNPNNKKDNNSSLQNRPKSLHLSRESTEFRIPAQIRQIRDGGGNDYRPFRLHRFLTLVSTQPEEPFSRLQSANDKNEFDPPPNTSLKLPPTSQTNQSSHSSINITNDLNTTQTPSRSQTYTDSNGFFLTTHVPDNAEINRIKRQNHRNMPSSSKQENVKTENNKKGKIICLPTAPVEYDSEDENFISSPSVPSRTMKRDLVLSANGRALITKNFPMVKGLQNYADIRPQSVKIMLKRRIELNSHESPRPSSVKPTDMIEWGGIRNPEKIFLNDKNENDVLSTKSESSPININISPKSNSQLDPQPASPKSAVNSYHINHSNNSGINYNGESSSPRHRISSSKTENTNSNDADEKRSNKSETRIEAIDSKAKSSSPKQAPKSSGKVGRAKSEGGTPPLSDPVKLTMRKERTLTRELTYMVDMESVKTNNIDT